MILAKMTSPEVAQLSTDLTVIIPVASLEQHSLHLPLFTDTMILDEVVRRVEAQIPDQVLLLPTQWLGYSMHHIKYPGTLSASSSTHLEIMFDIVSSMISHGFQQHLIINSHGGNEANISVLLQRIMDTYENAQVFATTPYSGPADGRMNDEVLDRGAQGSGHAGETETSMMMTIFPELVKDDLREDGLQGRPQIPGIRTYRRFDGRTNHGGMGDPRSATPEKGEKLFAIATEFLTDAIQRIRAGEYYKSK